MTEQLNDNAIYKYLQERKATSLIATIDRTFLICDDILKEVPKFFSNYTLHDINHSLRDINYMTEFIKDDLEHYSDFHLALIILSGLLHDIGMFVSDKEEKELEKKLCSAEFPKGSQKLLTEMQNEIRIDHGKRVNMMMDATKLTEGGTLRSLFHIGKSYNYSDILADICRSHCESVEWVLKRIPSDYPIAQYSNVNPQQIALLLRLGDGLDIDDRRAPDYLEQLLQVSGYSATEWAKHTPISNYEKVFKENDTYNVKFCGTCDDASIYRKVMSYISYIENDLVKISDIFQTYPAPYRNIKINGKIERNITPKGFEPTKLSFSINYEKIMKLLMGEHIYGRKTVGVRELLQNSIDAVLSMKERESKNPYSSYTPQIIIDIKKDANTVSFYDNGIGMTEEVLSNYFFQVGNSFYTTHEFKSLNPKYQPIGHFGIGFLACFMLSQNVTLETKSHQTQEAILMEFEKNSSYITKRKTNGEIFSDGHGTRITLNYSEIINVVFGGEDYLKEYIEKILLTEDDYKLTIISSGNAEHIKTSLFQEERQTIHADDMDISYKVDKFPKMINSVNQLLGPYDVAFYYFGPDKVTDDKYINYQVAHGYTLCGCNYTVPINTTPPIMLSKKKALDSKLLGMEDFNFSVLEASYYGEALHALKIPFIRNRDVYNHYLSAIKSQKHQKYSNALDKIKGVSEDEVSYIYVFGKKGHRISERVVQSMIYDTLRILNGGEIPIEWKKNEDKFKLEPRHVKLNFKRANEGRFFLPVDNRDGDNSLNVHQAKVYKNGIYVTIPFLDDRIILKGTHVDEVFVNLHSNEYSLDISRNEFDFQSTKKIARRIIKLIYQDMLLNTQTPYSESEKEAFLAYVETL